MRYNQPYGSTDTNAPFANGNPSTGAPGSIPPAESIEYPQREIVNAIVASGQTPSNSDLHQLEKAIPVLASSSTTALQNFYNYFFSRPLTYWRLDSPATIVPVTVLTTLGNYANNTSTVNSGTVVNSSTGVVTIGPNDTGVYILSATNAVDHATFEESIFISLNGSVIATSRSATGPSGSAESNAMDKSVTCVIRLAAGDQVSAVYLQNNAAAAAANSLNQPLGHFGGARVGG